MPRYISIKDDLCVVEQEIKTGKVVIKRGSVNHLWIYDRSGSMSGLLPELTTQLIKLSKDIPKGDTLTLGWFSGEGCFNWVFKGFKITEKSDYKALEQSIRNNSSPMNTTCFSEILSDTNTVIKDLSVFSKAFSLHFFTDGYPVVSNYSKETNDIFTAIKKIKGQILSSIFVGYGVYYNKELLSKMAEKMGSMLIHSSMVPEYSKSITRLIALSGSQDPKEEVSPVVGDSLAIYTVTDQGIVVYSVEDDKKLYINPQKGKNTHIYYVTREKPNKKSWDKIEMSDINFGDPEDRLGKALYAGALVLTQQTKTDLALELVGKIGDKSVVDSLTNAFTIEEYGRSEDVLNTCITDVSLRFSKGRDPSYLPPVDAFCVFELLSMLIDDDQASFFPYHEKFEYERIGVATKAASDYPSFKADKGAKCPFKDLTWHESRLNLSVKTTIKGTVTLNSQEGVTPEGLGLINPYSAHIFRNYTFIKDGRVHTKKFFISTSESTYRYLKNTGLVFEDTFKKDGVYGVDVSTLPSVNRAIAEGRTSAKDICRMALEEQKLKAKIKSIKWLMKDEFKDEDVEERKTSLTDAQVAFLLKNGIDAKKGGVYDPPVVKEEATDKYMVKYFDIKIKGLSSLPTVAKVREKIASSKKRTPVEELVEAGVDVYEGIDETDKKKKYASAEGILKGLQSTLNKTRAKIQETKIAVIVGRRWFDEFKSREETSLDLDGNVYTFDLGEEAVAI